jgi:hypothetical protein
VAEIPAFVSSLGPGGLLAAVVWMVLTGRLVPRSVADAWRTAYEQERAMRERLLVPGMELQRHVLESLPEPDPGRTP